MIRSLVVLLWLLGARTLVPAPPDCTNTTNSSDYPVIELRRYTIKAGEREHFVKRFESYFPEAIQQTGAIIAGEFLERSNQSMFTWIRGFRDLDDRARLNAALYDGPVWKEHRSQMNELLIDSDNVLLLRPLHLERGVPICPAVDPAKQISEARGVVVAQIFALKADGLKAFPQQAESAFAGYRAAGARDAGVLVTLDVPNNFPQLPIRTDGPYLVWLGILPDNQTLDHQFTPLAEQSAQSLSATGLLRSAPELVILDPAPRSRMRWLPNWR
jgi:hypothetical protein